MVKVRRICIAFFVLVNIKFINGASRVLELSDKIIDLHQERRDMWLVLFSVPWCSHCKRMEPIWSHVAQALYSSNVRVGKLDCTRFTNVGKHFEINGYPTILFLKHGNKYIYDGERSKDDLVHFAMRLSNPPVQELRQAEALDQIKSMTPNIFFGYVGIQDGLLWEMFLQIAETFQAHSYFYSIPNNIASKLLTIDQQHAVFVHKDHQIYHFPLADTYQSVSVEYLNHTLFKWVNEERFESFPRVTKSNLHHIVQTKKYLVMAVVEENKVNEMAAHEIEFKDMVEDFVLRHKVKYHRRFQFCWTGSPDLSHSLAAQYLPTPHLIVLNSSTHEHHIPDDDPLQLTHDGIEMFLESIYNRTAPTYGGNALSTRIYRAYFEAKKSLNEMWRGNPVLTALLFGLPLGFFSLIVYSIFCADILDAEELDEDHEKKE